MPRLGSLPRVKIGGVVDQAMCPTSVLPPCKISGDNADVVELVDSVDLGSTAKSVQVRVLLPAPNQYNPNQIFLVGDGFGLFVYFEKFEDTHFRNGVIKRPESKPRGPRKPKRGCS